MTVESAADRAAFLADFGIEATWSHQGDVAVVVGILDAPTRLFSGSESVDSVAVQASFTCAVAALPSGAAVGDDLSIADVSYAVRALLPDGTGLARAELERRR